MTQVFVSRLILKPHHMAQKHAAGVQFQDRSTAGTFDLLFSLFLIHHERCL